MTGCAKGRFRVPNPLASAATDPAENDIVRARACSVRGRAGPQRSRQSTVAAVTGSIEGDHGQKSGNLAAGTDAARRWWDGAADEYQREHGPFLGSARWVWGPEGWDESDLDLLKVSPGMRALEVGCGAAAGARWLVEKGVLAVGLDLSHRMLQHSRRLDQESGTEVPLVQADAEALPFARASFDLVASAYGALPFIANAGQVFAEIFRVLAPGGRLAVSVTHPIRWAFLDDPGPRGLRAARPYFDRSPYTETDQTGRVNYVEHHRTVGDWVDLVVTAGLRLDRLVEPQWKPENSTTWDGWSPLRGALLPGTLIIVAHKPLEG